MKLELKTITLENFKGIRSRTIDFSSPITKIEGRNATGKTTLATAYFWVFSNTDYDLKSNPPIFPIDVEECTPSVEIEMLVDGRPLKICKKQTRKVAEGNGVKKISLTNTYLVNDVPMAERDMVKKLSDAGFDFEHFSILANPNAFLAEKKDIQRKILFSMVSEYTDLDIARKMDGIDEARELLENYSVDEIKAMENAILRKINENYGKKGEILNAKIEGLENAKVEIDLSASELLKNDLNEKLALIDSKRKQNAEIEKNLDILREKSMALQFELSGLKNSLSATKKETLDALAKDAETKRNDLQVMAKKFRDLQAEKLATQKKLENANLELDTTNKYLAQAESWVFNEKDENCPTCGQKLPDTDIAKLHENFEKDKAAKVEQYKGFVSESEKLIAGFEDSLKNLDIALENCKTEGKTKQDDYTKAVAEYKAYAALPADEPTDDIKVKEKELAEINAKIESLKKAYIPNLDLEESNIREQLAEVEKKFAQAENNIRIDERIDDLRKDQMKYEQDRANAEKVLWQLDEIQKRKNMVVTDGINKHFSLVNWKMFDYLKNGSYTETCVPMVGDKELGVALNNAMQIRAKIDVCDSLQRFYGVHLPIFVDNSESLDSDNQNSLSADTQLILLVVKD